MAINLREKETFSRWDPADHLKSEEDMAGYLQACIEEAPDDTALVAAALDDIARAKGRAHAMREQELEGEAERHDDSQ